MTTIRLERRALFRIRTTERPRQAVLELAGELDLRSGPALLEAARERVSRAGDDAVLLVDLSGLAFLDASGLEALWAVRAETESGGRRLRLVRGPRQVQRVFELTGADAHFTFVDRAVE